MQVSSSTLFKRGHMNAKVTRKVHLSVHSFVKNDIHLLILLGSGPPPPPSSPATKRLPRGSRFTFAFVFPLNRPPPLPLLFPFIDMAESPIPVETRLKPDPPVLCVRERLVNRRRPGRSYLLLLWVLNHRFQWPFIRSHPRMVLPHHVNLAPESLGRNLTHTAPGGKEKPPAEGLPLPEPEG